MPRAKDREQAQQPTRVERHGELQLTVAIPTTRYVDQFLRLRCREELSDNEVFPNAKELTESFAAADAALHKCGVDPGSSEITAVVIADGATPRTAATLALRSRWRVVSVDPALRVERIGGWPRPIDRLEVFATRVQTLETHVDGACIVVAVHAHVALHRAMAALRRRGADPVGAVAIPCCGRNHQAPGLRLIADYVDWGIWSPERRVQVWTK